MRLRLAYYLRRLACLVDSSPAADPAAWARRYATSTYGDTHIVTYVK